MAQMIDKRPIEFAGEQKVFDCFKDNLDNSIVCYYNREIYGHEFDFCLLVKNIGLMIVEVKGWHPSHIINVKSPDEIVVKDSNTPLSSPKKQANGYKYALLNMLSSKYNIKPLICSSVAYPFISEVEYKTLKLNIVSEPEYTLFREDLEDKTKLMKKIGKIFALQKKGYTDKTSGIVYDTIRKHFESITFDNPEFKDENYSELRIYSNKLTISDIEEIVSNYKKGIKETIFVSSIEELEVIADNVNKNFIQNNIVYSKGQLLMNSSLKSDIKVLNKRINIFNFEAYIVPNLHELVTENLVIKNGKFGENYSIILEISKLCTFNLQQYILEHANCDKHIQVKAGAGTGKTYSMISRISYICHSISKSGVLDPSEEIAMLTFTDEAATNMRNRLKIQFRNYFVLTKNKLYLDRISSIEKMRISTIHSFAKNVIQKTSIPLGIGTDFITISGNYQRKQILKKHLSEYFDKKIKEDEQFIFNLDVSIYELEKYLLDFVDKAYNKGINIMTIDSSEFGEEIKSAPYLKEIIIDVLRNTEIEFSRYLLDNNSISLGQYMIYLNECINHETFNPRLYHYKYMFIDEFQDVDDSQIEIFKKMCDKIKFKLFIVGDLKQSIYRFRGATMDAFTKMGCDTDEWYSFSLNTNYRSDKRLLAEYQRIFSKMGNANLIPYTFADTLYGISENPDMENDFVEKFLYESGENREELLYDELFNCIKDRMSFLDTVSKTKKLNNSEKTIAILVRKNFEISNLIKEGKKRGVIVESDTNTNLYKLQSTVDFCKLSSALCNPYNKIYLFDLIQSNYIHIKFSNLNLIQKNDDEKLEILIDCLDCYFKNVMNLSWQELVSEVQKKPTLQILRKIYEATKPWKSYSSDLDNQTYYRINYELVFEELSRINKRSFLTLESINESLFLSITKDMEAKSRNLVESDDRIRVKCVTVHASKGLEYDTVILPFTSFKIDDIKNDSIEISYENNKVGYCFTFKHKKFSNEYFDTTYEIEQIIKEEARILYVALTRAINKFIWFGNEKIERISWEKMLEGNDLCQ